MSENSYLMNAESSTPQLLEALFSKSVYKNPPIFKELDSNENVLALRIDPYRGAFDQDKSGLNSMGRKGVNLNRPLT
mgnify:CR=1 FL=1